MHIPQQQTTTEPDEHEIIDHIVKHVGARQREVVVNYYVALKAGRFVILAGSDDMNKARLAQGMAAVLVGQPSLQMCSFQAHPWWVTRTKNPGYFAIAHAQFNTLKLFDFIDAALSSETAGLPYLFLVNIEQMSPAEVECYFHDLPRGLLLQADASVIPINLPRNLYVTGTLNVGEEEGLFLSQGARRYATIIQVNHKHFASSAGPHKTPQWGPDWQQTFARSAVRHGDYARVKLAQILPDDQPALAPLDELGRHLGAARFPSSVREKAWLYLANAFDGNRHGLFVEPVVENLRIAQDYVLAQYVLPYVSSQLNKRRFEVPRVWDEVTEYLARRFPRAHARAAETYRGHKGCSKKLDGNSKH